MAKWPKNRILIISFLLLVSLFLSFYQTKAQMLGEYTKTDGDMLEASEWNLLVHDFVMKASTSAQALSGSYGIGKSPEVGYLLDVAGDTKSTEFIGELSASYVRGGVFGSNLDGGGGDYSFPGYVGIGTVSPGSILNIVDTSNTLLKIRTNSGSIGQTAGILFGVATSDTYQQAGIFFERLGGSAEGSLYFATKASGADNVTKANARMTIDSAGNVGVGRTSPAYKLDVNGDINTIIGTSGGYRINNNKVMQQDSSKLTFGWVNASSNIAITSGGGIGFRTNNINDRVFIDTTGYFGIGSTTPSAPLSISSSFAGDFINVGGGYIGGLDLTPIEDDHAVPLAYLEGNYISTTTIADSTYWKLDGNKLYASSTAWNIGIGTNNPASVLTIGNNKWISSINSDSSSHVNMFRLNTNNQIEVGAPLILGSFEFAPDSGLVSFVDMPVTSASPDNTPQAYVFKIDRDNIMSVYAEADGAGGIKNKRVGIGTIAPTSLLTLSGGDLAIDHNKSIILNNSATNTTLLIGNYADGGGFTYGTSTSPLRYTASLAVEGDVKAHRLCIGEDCKGAWGDLVSAGMPSGSAGQLLVNTGSTNWAPTSTIFIASNGKVGIGTTTPAYNLDVQGAARIANIVLGTASATGYYNVNAYSSGPAFRFFGTGNSYTSLGASRVSIGSSYASVDAPSSGLIVEGNVGIGSTTPFVLLSINHPESGTYIDVGGGTIGGLDFTPPGPDYAASKQYVDSQLNTISSSQWVLNGNNLYASSTSWNVGIGTANPVSKLTVFGANPRLSIAHNVLNTGDVGIDFILNPAMTVERKNAIIVTAAGSYGRGNMSFVLDSALDSNNYDIAADTKMTILNNGNVGIGTTTPLAKLHVYDLVNANSEVRLGKGGDGTNGMTGFVQILPGTNIVNFYNNAGGRGLRINTNTGSVGGATAGAVVSGLAGGLIFSGNGGTTAHLGLTANGNVGIGTTNPKSLLNIEGPAGADQVDIAVLSMTHNAYSDGKGVQIVSYRDSAVDFDYQGIKFRTHNSPISSADPIDAMTIRANGNVGIGTTTPATRLSVLNTVSGDYINVNNGYIAGLDLTPTQPDHAVPLDYLESNYISTSTQIIGAFVQGGNTFGATANLGTKDNHPLNIITNDSTKMTILANGNVGIGTNPIHKLDISGVNNVGVSISSSDNNDNPYIQLAGDGKNITTEGMKMYYDDDTPNTYFDSMFNNDSYGFRFRTKVSGTPVDALTILGSGNVGIGTTNPIQKLEVIGTMYTGTIAGYGNSSYVWSQYSGNAGAITGGLVMRNGAGSVGTGIRIRQTAYNSGHTDLVTVLTNINNTSDFYISTSNAGSLTEKFRITGAGNVGIGTTTPATRLSVFNTVSGDYINVNNGYIAGLDLTPTQPDHAVPLDYLQSNYIPTSTLATGAFVQGGNSFGEMATLGTIDNQRLRFIANNSEHMTILATGNVGIGTNSPAIANMLTVIGKSLFSGDIEVNNNGGINMNGGNIYGINKLTVSTIDPLYRIRGVNYSTFAAAIVGGVKEEYVGKAWLDDLNKFGEYEKVIDFRQQPEGSDLWVWFKTIDWNRNNVEVFITPYGRFALTYYKIEGDKLILRADKPVEVAYRLIAKRHDWREWPTKAHDQEETPSFVID